MVETAIHRQVQQAQRGQLDRVICRVPSGWLVLGEIQITRGYCLLLPDPVVSDVNALVLPQRQVFFRDAGLIGDALLEITGAKRINYEILGNLEPALHLHLFPRFDTEPTHLKTKPIWLHNWEQAQPFDIETHGGLQKEILHEVQKQFAINHLSLEQASIAHK